MSKKPLGSVKRQSGWWSNARENSVWGYVPGQWFDVRMQYETHMITCTCGKPQPAIARYDVHFYAGGKVLHHDLSRHVDGYG